MAVDPTTHRTFPYPSRRHYEFSFLNGEIFDCAVENLKERRIQPIYELLVVTFGNRPNFSVEEGGLVGPEDYAAETNLVNPDQLVSPPPPFKSSHP